MVCDAGKTWMIGIEPVQYNAIEMNKGIKMSRRVCVDQEECIGCGSCQDICPEVFKINEDIEKSEVIKPEGGPEDLIEEAMGECPMSCIYWE